MGVCRCLLCLLCCGCCDDNHSKYENNRKSDEETDSMKLKRFSEKVAKINDKPMIAVSKLNREMRSVMRSGDSSYGLQRDRSIKERQRKAKRFSPDNTTKDLLKTYKCEFKSFLDSGNYSEVYQVQFMPQQKELALKVINLKKVERNYLKNHLPNELSVLKKLNKHLNIINTFEIVERKDRVFLFMEFASNGTITEWLRDKGAMPETIARHMFSGILDAVCVLQKQGIAHRDLKLENMLLSEEMNPKLSDFSYAIEVDPARPLSQQYCGTLPYFAPELLRRQPHNPLISDAWSLGVCFYIMVSDRLPFPLGDDTVMLEKELRKDWAFKEKVNQKLSKELKHIIKRLLEPDVKLRATPLKLKKNPWFTRR